MTVTHATVYYKFTGIEILNTFDTVAQAGSFKDAIEYIEGFTDVELVLVLMEEE